MISAAGLPRLWWSCSGATAAWMRSRTMQGCIIVSGRGGAMRTSDTRIDSVGPHSHLLFVRDVLV